MLKKLAFSIITFCLFLVFINSIENTKGKKEDEIRSFSCQDFQSSCEVTLGNQLYSVSFDRKTLYTEETVTMIIERLESNDTVINKETKLTGRKYNLAGVAEGITMYMGKIPLIFKQVPEKQGSYQTTFAFGSCTEKKMVWRLWLGQKKQHSLMTLDKDTLNNKGFLDVTVTRS